MLKQHFPFISHLQPHRDASQGHPASIHETSGPRVRSNLRSVGMRRVDGSPCLSQRSVVWRCCSKKYCQQNLWGGPLRTVLLGFLTWKSSIVCTAFQESSKIPLAELLLTETATMGRWQKKTKRLLSTLAKEPAKWPGGKKESSNAKRIFLMVERDPAIWSWRFYFFFAGSNLLGAKPYLW